MKNRLAEIGISFGAKRLTALSHERKLKDGLSIVHDIDRESLAILRLEPDDDLASCVFNSVR